MSTVNSVSNSSVLISEVGPRDGLQSVKATMATAHKLTWITQLHVAGLREIEVGSFVPAKHLPQLADTAELVRHALTLPDLTVMALVPNLRGAESALAGDADLMLLPLSASHAHSLANLRKTPDEVVAELGRIRAARDASGRKTLIEGGVVTAFGCTIQGLADTVGYADPRAVGELFAQVRAVAGDRVSTAHFHDTRGMGMANVLAALQQGVTRLDACLGGIGGCPHAPGASGNVTTEDLAWMLERMQIATGLDVQALLALRGTLAQWLEGEALHGTLWRAGLPRSEPAGHTARATVSA